MDAAARYLYFSVMLDRHSPLSGQVSPHAPASAHCPVTPPRDGIPAFFLYGEPLQAPDERLIHIETIASRSSLHDWVIRPHRHRDLHQVLLTQQGTVELQLDGNHRTLEAPALVVVPPGCVHGYQFEPGTRGLVISFAPSLLAEIATHGAPLARALDQPQCRSLNRAALGATDLEPLSQMMLREFTRAAPGRMAALRGLLGAMLANALRLSASEVQPDDAQGAARELAARYRQLIERDFRTHRSVRDFTAELGVSESRLRRACLKTTGQSPVEVVHLRLLVEAERLLRYTTLTVAQIAYHLGFEDPAYFSRFFTRWRRSSPRAFRRRVY